MVALVCQEEEMDTVVIFVVSPLNARLNAVLRLRWEPESLKESSISFLLVEKEEKKLLVEHWYALKHFNLVGFFTVERMSCSEKKPKRQTF